jgi:hypothetical protein
MDRQAARDNIFAPVAVPIIPEVFHNIKTSKASRYLHSFFMHIPVHPFQAPVRGGMLVKGNLYSGACVLDKVIVQGQGVA